MRLLDKHISVGFKNAAQTPAGWLLLLIQLFIVEGGNFSLRNTSPLYSPSQPFLKLLFSVRYLIASRNSYLELLL